MTDANNNSNSNNRKIVAHFKLERVTPGALLYKEYDPITKKVYLTPNTPGCKVGSTYLRKDQLPMKDDVDPNWPKLITAEYFWE